ncbi:YHS domain-containing (seleno)protein [Halofilum ochraceum]|uniref:YHS domain-containing (seleno)protein n=1 Tax=Halofilum ochraceum TaxID=1611323 RepID=UPI0008D9CBE1|nr:YHS domain-containing (seleno)protein [Halofilum ochraceum]
MKRITYPIALLLSLLLAGAAHASGPVYTGWFGNLAADGHDVVAYFTRGEPVEGSAEHSVEWNGAEWRFASAEHLERFRADPERYAPAYGGHCAYAVAEGYTAAGDPEHWTIHGGRLYLNYNAEVQTRWEADRDDYIAAANDNWPEVAE